MTTKSKASRLGGLESGGWRSTTGGALRSKGGFHVIETHTATQGSSEKEYIEELLKQTTKAFADAIQANQFQSPYMTYLVSLGDPELRLTTPIPVTIRRDDDEFLASFFDANISTGGETPQAAISHLQSLIADFFRMHEEQNEADLGPSMKQQRYVLRDVICRSPKNTLKT